MFQIEIRLVMSEEVIIRKNKNVNCNNKLNTFNQAA